MSIGTNIKDADDLKDFQAPYVTWIKIKKVETRLKGKGPRCSGRL